jgi:hypothetical protein
LRYLIRFRLDKMAEAKAAYRAGLTKQHPSDPFRTAALAELLDVPAPCLALGRWAKMIATCKQLYNQVK